MERLRDYTSDLLLKMQRESAWRRVNENFDAKRPRRFISGIAATSRKVNDVVLNPRGFHVMVPNLLLWNHDYTYPLGKIIAVEAQGPEIRFQAEVSNCQGACWLDAAWESIVARKATRISIYARNLASYKQEVWTDWCAEEISVGEAGADPSARICRAWLRAPGIYLDGRPNQKVYWSE